MTALFGLSVLLLLGSFICLVFIYVHAFQRSVGTGFMVLCIPCYVLYYAFSQFEHPKKNLIIAGWLGLGVPGLMLNVAGRIGMMHGAGLGGL
jgi:hypothetical protein